MFIDRTLAARIDAAEGRMCAAVAEAIPGHAIVPLGGGLSVFARPDSPVNKIIGVGFGQALEEQALAELERRGAVRFEVSTLADPEIAKGLTRRGYTLDQFENVLGLKLPVASRGPAPGVDVEPCDATAEWQEVVIEGFCHPDETSGHTETFPRDVIETVMTDFARASGFQRYLARLDGEPAGAASMRVEDGVAFLAGATTLPRFRRRGVQGSLLARRLVDAAGCELACITTAPGTRSQANAQRQGFSLLYARAVLTR